MSREDYEITLLVTAVLEQLGVPYAIGGSVAGSFHGLARTTLDSDLIADLQMAQVEPFVRQLQDAFYVDASAVRQAIAHQRSFNLIHYETDRL